MYVEVNLRGDSPRVALREPDDFRSFKVVVADGGDRDDVGRALHGTGRLEPPHAWIDVAALRSLGRGDDEAWVEQLDGMVAFVPSKQWVDEGGAVRAHCEWRAGEPAAP